MLIAEDLLLLLTDDDTGRLRGSSTEVDLALGGALLLELTLSGHVDVAGPGEETREGRLVVRDPGPTGDPLLAEALERIADKQGRKPQDVVSGLGKRLRPRLYDRLASQGILREEHGKVLGLFPSTRWPAQHAEHEVRVRSQLTEALRSGSPDTPRTGALVALLAALNAVHHAVDPDVVGVSRHDLQARAKAIAEGDWASAAVRKAIDSMIAVVVAVAATSVATSGGSS
jgi:hypothetical protein